MKILYLHQYFNTPDMSGGTRSYEMARRFVAQGHEVHMITSWREPRDDQAWFENQVAGIHIHWLPVEYSNHMSFADRIKAFFKFAFKSARKAVEIKADVVFATSTPLTIALPAVYAAKKQKIPMVFEIRDLWPELPIAMGALKNPITRFLAKRLELFAYRNAASIVALSPGMKDGVLRTGYPSNKVAVIPNSSDIELFRVDSSLGEAFRAKRDWLGDKPLLIYTGTFGLINGVGYMVDLAEALSKLNSDVRILLIGGGAEFNKVTERAEASGVLNHNLFIEKSLPKKEIPAVLSAATMASALFIDKPEMRPNSANKFFDALASGTPLMINYGGWMHELIEARGCGLAMWKKQIDQVAKELDQKMHDAEWLKQASQSAMKLAEESFDRDVLAKQLLAVLEATVQGQPENSETIAPGKYD
jgi:glycosyltransferase involved in cell wall biosynthesis